MSRTLRFGPVLLALILVLPGCIPKTGLPPVSAPGTAVDGVPDETIGSVSAPDVAEPEEVVPAGTRWVDMPSKYAISRAEALETYAYVFGDTLEMLPAEVWHALGSDYQHLSNRWDVVSRWISREGRYLSLVQSELERGGLPEGLRYLAMIESGFNPVAVSRVGATGLWQFMPATARDEGLRLDEWVDERRDPVASTRAAVKHLNWLKRELGAWDLALAGYNAGIGRVRRAQASAGTMSYSSLVRLQALPAETRAYVPRVLAAAALSRSRGASVEREAQYQYDEILVPERTLLSAVARAGGLPRDVLYGMNEHLVRRAAPPGNAYPVRVPMGTSAARLLEGLSGIEREERIYTLDLWKEITHTVAAGESLWRIARRYGIGVSDLQKSNPKISDNIRPGQKLTIRTPPGHTLPQAENASRSAWHTVAPGETMSGLAARYELRMADLVRWNDMSQPRPLRIGEKIRVAAP